jgi:predicted nucleic acid-binding Zn ribbon protein
MSVCLPVYSDPMPDEKWQSYLKTEYEKNLKLWGHPYMVYKIQCRICGKEFFARRPEAKYCSGECDETGAILRRRERARALRQKTCRCCKKPFEGKRKDSEYCSHKCKQAAYRDRLLRMSTGVI